MCFLFLISSYFLERLSLKERSFFEGGIYLNYSRIHVCFLFLLLFLIFGKSVPKRRGFFGGGVGVYLNECIQCAPVLKHF